MQVVGPSWPKERSTRQTRPSVHSRPSALPAHSPRRVVCDSGARAHESILTTYGACGPGVLRAKSRGGTLAYPRRRSGRNRAFDDGFPDLNVTCRQDRGGDAAQAGD